KTNTARRAGMAAAIEARARGESAMADILDAIADGIEEGTITFLKSLRHYTDLETLLSLLRDGRRNRAEKEGRDRRAAAEETPALEDTLHVEIPWPAIEVEIVRNVACRLSEKKGCLLAARRIARCCGEAQERNKQRVEFTGQAMISRLEEFYEKAKAQGIRGGGVDWVGYELTDIRRLRR